MTAAHYIALLLLSTAAQGSREHAEIVQQNGPGIWQALADLELVRREPTGRGSDLMLWSLTERGRALVQHILALPLPEQVNVWRMPTCIPMHIGVVEYSGREVPVTARERARPRATVEDSGILEENGPPPPPPKPPKPIQGVTPAADVFERRMQALELINRGFGTSEVAVTLEMEQAEVDAIFLGNG